MKTIYRIGAGRFLQLDSHIRPRRFSRGSFFIACLSACLLALVISTFI